MPFYIVKATLEERTVIEQTEQVLRGVCPACGNTLQRVSLQGSIAFLHEYAMTFPEAEMVPWDAPLASRMRGTLICQCNKCHVRWQATNRAGQDKDAMIVRFRDGREPEYQHWVLDSSYLQTGVE